ncbi:MAG: GspE/PulE family protein [Acidimicrobiia bacterium]
MSQSGRISVKVGGRAVDLRVETLPTVWGEKIVMRIVDKTSGLINLDDLGFSDYNRDRFLWGVRLPYGAIIVSGPTGSGKSTTLYAALGVLNDTERNIITVEDPVEQRIAGLNQVQVHTKAGLNFATVLRSILRADPDVVMVGEMRDTETARIGIEAALTGHLVLSTIHTNGAPSVLTRLVDMGVEPFLVASALDCVVGQRLARRLCTKCKEAYVPTPDALREAGWVGVDDLVELPTLHDAVGCAACAKTGYVGRVAVHEIMRVSEEIERMVSERTGSAEDIKRVAVSEGMYTLRQDGLQKAALGITSLEEVMRAPCEGGVGPPPSKAGWLAGGTSRVRGRGSGQEGQGGSLVVRVARVRGWGSGPRAGWLAGGTGCPRSGVGVGVNAGRVARWWAGPAFGGGGRGKRGPGGSRVVRVARARGWGVGVNAGRVARWWYGLPAFGGGGSSKETGLGRRS